MVSLSSVWGISGPAIQFGNNWFFSLASSLSKAPHGELSSCTKFLRDLAYVYIAICLMASIPTALGWDEVILEITDYVFDYQVESPKALQAARTSFLDSIGCAIESVSKSEECRRLLGHVIPGTEVPDGFRLPGTSLQLDPLKGAFDFGTCIRYMDHNDTMGGAEWGHPSGIYHLRLFWVP